MSTLRTEGLTKSYGGRTVVRVELRVDVLEMRLDRRLAHVQALGDLAPAAAPRHQLKNFIQDKLL